MPTNEDLPESFIEQVKAALEKLYDFQALHESPLARQFTAQAGDTGARQLRSDLIDAIESLNPGQNVSVNSGTARLYNLIYLHYISRMTIQQAAWEVGVSLRQAYRDLRRGQELVSAVMWHKLNTEGAAPAHSAVDSELSRLGNTTVAPLQDLLDAAIRPIQVLADKYAVAIHVEAPERPILLTTNPMIAQQVLTYVLSQIVQQVNPPSLTIQLKDEEQFVVARYAGEGLPSLQIEPAIRQMMEQVQWAFVDSADDNGREIGLRLTRQKALILVIDDNEGLTHLLQRYLTDDAYTVMSAPNTEQGVEIVAQLQPNAILLDVMMPGIDGWELLQRLRMRGETQAIPVIICSVINDPELAFALGAAQHVSKPVTREALLTALQGVGV